MAVNRINLPVLFKGEGIPTTVQRIERQPRKIRAKKYLHYTMIEVGDNELPSPLPKCQGSTAYPLVEFLGHKW